MRTLATTVVKMRVLVLCASLISTWFVHAAPKPKYALALYHFNIQYVAGDYRIERRIIQESLKPLLQLYQAHPSWKGDLEIQGYALEILRDEYPEVLALLKKLVEKEQIELIVAHYSDQFFLAYPRVDLLKSQEISDELLKELGLRRSGLFFAQEGQWTPALPAALQGKYQLILTSKDPFAYYFEAPSPLMEGNFGGQKMLVFHGDEDKSLPTCEWKWAFFGDGENFNTKNYANDFLFIPELHKENENKFLKLEKEGYQFLTVSEFTRKLLDAGHTPPALPDLPEGTWVMRGGGPYNWMGRQGRLGNDTDGITRALCAKARGWVLLAETFLAHAQKLGVDLAELRKTLRKAWRHLLLSEVSDSSGWAPIPVEVRYTEDEATIAIILAKQIITEVIQKSKLGGKSLVVDTRAETVEEKAPPSLPAAQPAASLVSFSVRAERYEVSSHQLSPNLHRLHIKAWRPNDGAVEIAFPADSAELRYSPPLGEETIQEVPLKLLHDPILALANGWIYLGNGISLVKDCTVEHLACTWNRKASRLIFREELKENNPSMEMIFYLVMGQPERGHAAANRLNTSPSFSVIFDQGRLSVERQGLEGISE